MICTGNNEPCEWTVLGIGELAPTVKGRGTFEKSQRRARSGAGNRSGLPSTYPSDSL